MIGTKLNIYGLATSNIYSAPNDLVADRIAIGNHSWLTSLCHQNVNKDSTICWYPMTTIAILATT